jgi:Zn-dependent metalloprotease
MSHCRNPLHCIIPPHMLEHLATHTDDGLRGRAFQALTTSAHMRGRRELLGLLPMGAPSGGKRRTIYDASKSMTLPGKLVRGETDPESSDSAVNEAYDGLGATYDLYHDVFGRSSIDNKGLRLDATVHYGTEYDNAFWDGQQMVFGDGDAVIFSHFTGSIDVIGHELTHGVTQYDAGLEYQGQPGALNESMSDVFGSLVKQYHNNQSAADADWLIGAGILAKGIKGVALRSMKAPGTAYHDSQLGDDPQPATMSKLDPTTSDNGGVHINSGIPNHAFYLLATALGGNAWEDAGHIWYSTLRALHPQSDFLSCANMSYGVAGALFGSGSKQQQAVRDAWDGVGIKVATGPQAAAPKVRRGAPAIETGGTHLEQRLEKLTDELSRLVDVLSKKK